MTLAWQPRIREENPYIAHCLFRVLLPGAFLGTELGSKMKTAIQDPKIQPAAVTGRVTGETVLESFDVHHQ